MVVRAYREGRLEQHALVGGEESLVIEYLADTRLLAPVDARVEACVDSVGPIDEGGVGAHEAGEQVVWYGLEAARTVAHPRLHLPEYAPQLLRMGRDSAECPGEWEWEWGWQWGWEGGLGGWGAGMRHTHLPEHSQLLHIEVVLLPRRAPQSATLAHDFLLGQRVHVHPLAQRP